MPLTKAQLKEEVEVPKRKAKELEAQVNDLSAARMEREEAAVTAERRVRREPKMSGDRLASLERELAEAVAELSPSCRWPKTASLTWRERHKPP